MGCFLLFASERQKKPIEICCEYGNSSIGMYDSVGILG